MVLRNLILAMLLVASSSQSFGQSQMFHAEVTRTPNLYEVLGLNTFEGETADFIAKGDERIKLIDLNIQNNPNPTPRFLKAANAEKAKIRRAVEILSHPVARFEHDVELTEHMETKLNIYYAYDLSPFEDENGDYIHDYKNAIALGKYRLEVAVPAGAINEYIYRGQAASKHLQANIGQLLDPVQKKRIDTEIAKIDPRTSSLNGLEKFGWWGTSFTVGTAGFMAGNWVYTQLKCTITHDPALCWAAYDQLRSADTRTGLFAFGMGAEATSLLIKNYAPASRVPERYRSAPGMVVGSLLNQFASKAMNSKFRKVFWNNLKENWYETQIYGNAVRKRYEAGEKLNGLDITLKFTPQEQVQQKQKLQSEINGLDTQIKSMDQDIEQHQENWHQAIFNMMKEMKTFEPGEFSTFSIGSFRMILASMAAAEGMGIMKGLWALGDAQIQKFRYLKGSQRDKVLGEALNAMSPEEKDSFLENQRRIAELKKFKTEQIDRFRNQPQLKEALRLRNASNYEALQKFYVKSVREETERVLNGPASAERFFARFKDAFKMPTNAAEAEIATGLGRRLLLKGIVPQFVMAGINALAFLGSDDLIRVVSTRVYNGALLQKRSEKHLNDLSQAAINSQVSNDPKIIGEFITALSEYNQLWDNYRQQAITGDTINSIKNWDSRRDKFRHHLDLDAQWFSWFARGKDKKDPKKTDIYNPDINDDIFVKNNLKYDPDAVALQDETYSVEDTEDKKRRGQEENTVDEEWHADPVATPIVFEKEKQEYMKDVSPFTEAKMSEMLTIETKHVRAVAHEDAIDMDNKLRPILLKEYFGEGLPFYLRAVDSFANSSLNFLLNIINTGLDIPRAIEGSLNTTAWNLPGSWAQAYTDQIYFLSSTCQELSSKLLPTTLVLDVQKACRDEKGLLASRNSIKTNPFDSIVKSAAFRKTQAGLAANQLDDLTRSDIVAMALAGSLHDELAGMIYLYTAKVNHLLSQPKSDADEDKLAKDEQAAASKAALERALKKDDDEFKSPPEVEPAPPPSN